MNHTRTSAVLSSVVLFAFLPPSVTRAVSAQARPSNAPVFPSRTEVVQLDMVVRGRDGRPVTDLRADEVQVFEDGKPCAVSAFRLVRTEVESPSGPIAPSESVSHGNVASPAGTPGSSEGVRPDLPAPDAGGRIALIGALPISSCGPGSYEVLARARQAAAEAMEGTSFTIAPAPGAAAGGSSTAASEGARAPLAAARRPIEAAADVLPLLEKAGRYVVEFQQSFRNVVAEEVYRQWAGSKVRTLRSDLVFVTVPGDLPWATFRDVYEVDGQKVRDRDARLEAIFARTSEASLERADAIRRESARYNLGPLYRTVNVPTLALSFLHPTQQWRFRWDRRGTRRFFGHDGIELHAVETARPTLVRADGGDLPAEARFWVEVGTGRVLRSETSFSRGVSPQLRDMLSSIDVQYRPEPALGLWVPAEMYERSDNVPYATRDDIEGFDGTIQGRARYANLRRFSVTTDSTTRGTGQPQR
ncbi:MAG: hypothetical protein ACM3PV_13730 [Betaproteobacteria bacterium]